VSEGCCSGSVEGCWTASTSGGCSNNLWRFFQNPQWRFDVPDGCAQELCLFLECPAEHSVNVRLFSGSVARPDSLRTARSSGAYRQGCCLLRVADLEAGAYVVVASTFRPGLCGTYRLAWHASRDVRIRPQPHPFALPLEPPLLSVARKVPQGNRVRFGLKAAVAAPTLVSFRVQSACKQGQPPSLELLQVGRGEDASQDKDLGRLEQAAQCELQKQSYADSYFAFSGAAAILLAELLPGVAYVLQVLVPNSGPPDDADLYLTSDGCVAVDGGVPMGGHSVVVTR